MTRKTKVARARPPPSRNRTLSSPTILLAIVVLSIGLVYVFQPDLLPSSLWLARKPARGTTKFDGHDAENVLAGQGGSAPSFDKAASSLAYKSIWSDAPPVSKDALPVSKDALRTRVVAVGDLHGDIGNARKVLNMAGVVDEEGKWTGDVDVFVQTGDIIDRGDDTIKLFFWMEELRAQAELAGGRVLSHLGNHEWMNAIGDWRYVPQTEIKTFGSVAARQKMLSTGRIGRAWATNYSTTSRVPLHDALGLPNEDYPPPPSAARLPAPLSHAAYSFVHGGLSPTYAHLTPFPSAINALGESLLSKLYARGPVPPHPPAAYPGLPVDATQDEIELYDTNGPLWYRGWALSPEEDVCGAVDAVLEKTGTRRMVMGHTPDFSKIVSRCGGKILVIDTGISHAYGGVLAALAVEYSLERGSDRGWTEHEVVRAVYESGPVVLVDETRTIPTWDPSL